jgi:hypothetical protein
MTRNGEYGSLGVDDKDIEGVQIESPRSAYSNKEVVGIESSLARVKYTLVIYAAVVCALAVTTLVVPSHFKLTRSNLAQEELSRSAPNIIFILADDLGYGSLTSDVAPFLSSLRDSGVNIENYYSQQSCTPARASLMTGRYAMKVGWGSGTISDNYDGGLSLNYSTIAEVLSDAGYTTYMYGKWNLGNRSPRYLPTARGFDYFLGYMNSMNHYWSKVDPSHSHFHDFMYSDSECYYMYDGDDLKHYSTHLYRDWAVSAISTHDFDSSPMFMYLAFQAVHDPFSDVNSTFTDGIPDDYLSATTLSYISANVTVRKLHLPLLFFVFVCLFVCLFV